MNLSDVSIPKRFLSSCPSEEKLSACRAFYEEHGDIDRPVVVAEDGLLFVRHCHGSSKGLFQKTQVRAGEMMNASK